jgi:hypothetical protein
MSGHLKRDPYHKKEEEQALDGRREATNIQSAGIVIECNLDHQYSEDDKTIRTNAPSCTLEAKASAIRWHGTIENSAGINNELNPVA